MSRPPERSSRASSPNRAGRVSPTGSPNTFSYPLRSSSNDNSWVYDFVSVLVILLYIGPPCALCLKRLQQKRHGQISYKKSHSFLGGIQKCVFLGFPKKPPPRRKKNKKCKNRTFLFFKRPPCPLYTIGKL